MRYVGLEQFEAHVFLCWPFGLFLSHKTKVSVQSSAISNQQNPISPDFSPKVIVYWQRRGWEIEKADR
jgi:hypothetical protein